MKKLILLASLFISLNIAYADGQSHDHDMSKMKHSHTEMSQEQMKNKNGDSERIEHKHEHKHTGKESSIETKKMDNMDDMNMGEAEKMHDHMKMK